MPEKTIRDRRMSARAGMLFGGVWSFASVGWIATVVLGVTWFRSGWDQALFWFGIIMLTGAALFFLALACTVACELLKLSEERSRRDALNYFSWAFLYNLVLGLLAISASVQFGSL